MSFCHLVRLFAVAGLGLAGLVHAAPVVSQTVPGPPRQGETSAITTNRTVTPQVRRTVPFEKQGVFFSTDFDGARMADVRQIATGSFQLVVEAENYPINDSPWYAFKIWSTSNQPVRLELNYARTFHRYNPRSSHDRLRWDPVPDSKISESASRKAATFSLDIGPEPLYVAAQELITSSDYGRWVRDIAALPFVRSRVLGKSTLGKPIHLLEITESDGPADRVLIIGRQHPPEVTGALALLEFVQVLCGDSELARAYRQRFNTTIVPLLNPDGVDAGHWRHNSRGTDLNRDWGQFNQAETRLVRDVFLRMTAEPESRILFALDFHSTRSDVFYVTHPPTREDGAGNPARNVRGAPLDITREWLRGLRERLPDYPLPSRHTVQRTSGHTRSFSPWISRTAGIGAVTHETGDKTDRDTIKRVARAGADSMMFALLNQAQSIPSRGNGASGNGHLAADQRKKLRVALYKGEGTGGNGPPAILKYFSAKPDVRVTEVGPAEIQAGILQDYDVVIFAGGSASKQAETIGDAGRKLVRDFVEKGGGYVGICAGAYLASSGFSWGLGLLDSRTVSPKWRRGAGNVQIELTDLGRRKLADMPGEKTIFYQNGPILQPAELPDIDDYEVLAWYRSELAEHDSPKGIMTGSPAVLSGRIGEGRVICFGPHPEQTEGLEKLLEGGIIWAGGAGDPAPTASNN